MAYTQSEAIKRAASWVGKAYPIGWCQKWVCVEVFASGGVGDFDGDGAADAEDGWRAARKKVATSDPYAIPAGYPVYFLGGTHDFGHAAVSAGSGYIFSTDQPSPGVVGKVPISNVTRGWGLTLAGYVIEDGNGNVFTDPPAVPWSARFEVTHTPTWARLRPGGVKVKRYAAGARFTADRRKTTADGRRWVRKADRSQWFLRDNLHKL